MKRYFLKTLNTSELVSSNHQVRELLKHFYGIPLWKSNDYAVYNHCSDKSHSARQNNLIQDKLSQANANWINHFSLTQLQLITFIMESNQFKPVEVTTINKNGYFEVFQVEQFNQLYLCNDILDKTHNQINSIKFVNSNYSLKNITVFTDGVVQVEGLELNSMINLLDSIINQIVLIKPTLVGGN